MSKPPEEVKAESVSDPRYFKGLFLCPATRDIYIEFPPEDAEPGMVGKLKKSLYGTRDVACNWAEAYTKVLLAMGYNKGPVQPL